MQKRVAGRPGSCDRTLRVRCLPLLIAAAFASACCALAQDAAATAPEETSPVEAARALITEKQYEAAIEAVAPALESDDPATMREAKLVVADCQRYLAEYEEAIASYNALLAEDVQDQTMVTALTGLADCLIRTGKLTEADAAIERALALYPEITDAAYAARGSSFYTRNVAQYYSAVEFARGQLSKLARSYASDGNQTAALLTYRKLYHEFADHRKAPDIAIKVGDLLQEQGSHEWAIPFYLAALDTSGDRCYSREAKISVNQRYLDAVSQPPPATRIEAAVAGMNACLTELAPEQALDEVLLRRFAEKWNEALAATYLPFADDWLDHWRYLADGVEREPWRSLCQLAMAQSSNRDGYYEEALEIADEAEPDGPATAALKQRLSLARAQAHLGLRELAEAGRYAEWAAAGPDRVVASEAMLLRARALEMSLDLGAARQAYTVASHESVVSWDRRLAEYAVKRVDELAAHELTTDPGLVVLPDDRTTRGDWYSYYGSEAFVLCAQQSPNDIGGGSRDFWVKPATLSDDEPFRLWISVADDDDPAALYNPVSRVRRSANWDDHGEQVEIGGGPDLLLRIGVPEGHHVLSLYFANDHNYYEPNRCYTLSVTDAGGELLAVTDVEDFGGGVYKQFEVTGPRQLRVHIWRNLSLNTLVSGVFLDGVQPPMSVPSVVADGDATEAWARWQEARCLHRGAAAEREAFEALVDRVRRTASPDELSDWLDGLAMDAFEARRFGEAQWAAAARTRCLLAMGDSKAAEQHLIATVRRFLQRDTVFAPIRISASIAMPFAEETYREYVALKTEGMEPAELASFCRREADGWYRRDNAPLLRLALDALVAAVGEDGLTAEDHRLLTACSRDAEADIERLTTLLAETDDPAERRGLQMLLLGRYFSADQPEAALQLAQALQSEGGDAGAEHERAAVNALYNVGVYHFQRGDYEQAKPLLAEVIAKYPQTHWARFAGGYLSRMSNSESEQ